MARPVPRRFTFGNARRLIHDLCGKGRRVSMREGVPRWRLLVDMVQRNWTAMISRAEYFVLELWRPDVPERVKRTFISKRMYFRATGCLSPRAYDCIMENKLATKRLLMGAGLPVARLLAVFHPGWGHTAEGRPFRDIASVEAWLNREAPAAFVLKPIEGLRGLGVLVLERQPGESVRYASPEGKVFDAAALVGHVCAPSVVRGIAYQDGTPYLEAYVLEERLHPHPELRVLSPHACCTVRIVTLLADGPAVEFLGAMFKIQTRRQSSDNFGGTAVYAGVDLSTGRLTPGMDRYAEGPPHLTHDPESGTGFVGHQLPLWPETLALVRRAALAFPLARSISWDVAITADGPVIVEGNYRSSPCHIQAHMRRGYLQGEFARLCADAPDRRLRILARNALGTE